MFKRTNAADVANMFIRCILCDFSEAIGSFSESDWEKTLEYFNYKCAYTGEEINKKTAVKDHLIPQNRESCGMNIYGNIVPATRKANSANKSNKNYKEFLMGKSECLNHLTQEERISKISKIEEFLSMTKYQDKTQYYDFLPEFCKEEYEKILNLCRENKNYINKNFNDKNNR